MAAPSPRDFGRRLRAAMVLADVTLAEIAAEVEADIGIGLRTIERITRGDRPAKRWEVEKFARALDVPEWFLLEGLDGATTRASALLEELDAANATVDEILQAVARLTDRALQAHAAERERPRDARRAP